MTLPPSRLDELVATLESGNTITQEQLRRVGQLQALDLLATGRKFVQEVLDINHQANDDLLIKRETEKLHVINQP